MRRGRSKYPLELIEKDFCYKRMRFIDITKKYGISGEMCNYYSKKLGWRKKRDDYLNGLASAIHTQQAKEVKAEHEESFDLVKALEKLLELKLTLETKVMFGSLTDDNKKSVMHLINKSKDGVGDLTKTIQLLKGLPTDNVKLTDEESQSRRNRLMNMARSTTKELVASTN